MNFFKLLMGLFGLLLTLLSCSSIDNSILVTDKGIYPDLAVDQTDKINKLIEKNPGASLVFPSGIYNIASVKIKSKIGMIGKGDVVFSGVGTSSKPMIHILNGEVAVTNITLEGNHKRTFGIVVYNFGKPVFIDKCTVQNFYGTDSTGAIGIKIRRSDFFVEIKDTKLLNIDGPGNGKSGDRVGANRGIVINDVDSVVVSDCYFNEIKGFEDGDGLYYIRWDDKQAKRVLITNNVFENIYKRAIKITGDHAIVSNNKIYSQKDTPSYSAISIYGNNNNVFDNTINLNTTTFGIQVTKSSNNKIQNNLIEIKKFSRRKEATPIYIMNASNISVKKNAVRSPKKESLLLKGENKNIER